METNRGTPSEIQSTGSPVISNLSINRGHNETWEIGHRDYITLPLSGTQWEWSALILVFNIHQGALKSVLTLSGDHPLPIPLLSRVVHNSLLHKAGFCLEVGVWHRNVNKHPGRPIVCVSSPLSQLFTPNWLTSTFFSFKTLGWERGPGPAVARNIFSNHKIWVFWCDLTDNYC